MLFLPTFFYQFKVLSYIVLFVRSFLECLNIVFNVYKLYILIKNNQAQCFNV